MVAFIAGAIAGAAVALLFAPATGEETRDYLGQRAREGKDRATEAARQGREILNKQRENLTTAFDRAREQFTARARRGRTRDTTRETFLGLIALGVLAMAAGQVVAFVMAMRATRRMSETLNRVERDLRPIVANVQAMSADAKRAAALATAQVERADRLFDRCRAPRRRHVGIVQRSILVPARDGMAFFKGMKAAFMSLRDFKSRLRRSPHIGPVPRAVPDPGDDDHASFIG